MHCPAAVAFEPDPNEVRNSEFSRLQKELQCCVQCDTPTGMWAAPRIRYIEFTGRGALIPLGKIFIKTIIRLAPIQVRFLPRN